MDRDDGNGMLDWLLGGGSDRDRLPEDFASALDALEGDLTALAEHGAEIRNMAPSNGTAGALNDFLGGLSRAQSALVDARRAADAVEDWTEYDPSKAAGLAATEGKDLGMIAAALGGIGGLLDALEGKSLSLAKGDGRDALEQIRSQLSELHGRWDDLEQALGDAMDAAKSPASVEEAAAASEQLRALIAPLRNFIRDHEEATRLAEAALAKVNDGSVESDHVVESIRVLIDDMRQDPEADLASIALLVARLEYFVYQAQRSGDAPTLHSRIAALERAA